MGKNTINVPVIVKKLFNKLKLSSRLAITKAAIAKAIPTP